MMLSAVALRKRSGALESPLESSGAANREAAVAETTEQKGQSSNHRA